MLRPARPLPVRRCNWPTERLYETKGAAHLVRSEPLFRRTCRQVDEPPCGSRVQHALISTERPHVEHTNDFLLNQHAAHNVTLRLQNQLVQLENVCRFLLYLKNKIPQISLTLSENFPDVPDDILKYSVTYFSYNIIEQSTRSNQTLVEKCDNHNTTAKKHKRHIFRK